MLKKTPDTSLLHALKENLESLAFSSEILKCSLKEIRQHIQNRIARQKIVGIHYQHVDGTSFSAPIVCSIIAQMLEANPQLSPRRIKQILSSTTDKIFDIPLEKQGHGLIHPRKCVKEAENEKYRKKITRYSSPWVQKRKVHFYYENNDAQSVAVAGDFTNWKGDQLFLSKREGTPLWELEMEFPFKGIYSYKYVVDGQWICDPECDNVEPDGYGGLNTRLNIYLD